MSAGATTPPRPPTVLAVDDSATYRNRLADILEEQGYDVVTATSGEEALAVLGARPIDCVLLDMVMPGMSGEETCRRIKASVDLQSIPVLMLTAREGQDPTLMALRAGADDFVTKSDDFQILEARLRAHIRRRRFEDEIRRIREELLNAQHAASQAQAERELAETRARLLDDLEAKNVELQRAKDYAEAAVHARDEFLVIASHELRTPLTSLQLHLQSIQRALDATGASCPTGRIITGIDVATRQTERLATLVDSLLDASRISAGRLELHPERLDLAAVVRDAAERLGEIARRAGSTVVVVAGHPVIGTWDRVRCEQVTTNLLSNAIRYGRGKPIEVEVTQEGQRARLVVRDAGIGIDEEQRTRIFGIFERGVSSRNYGGLGLGLYITRQIVEAHGGTIHVTSRLGQGLTFVVELPVEAGAKPQQAA
ncbi:MAG: hybrid sensor histidine kinase/response regulator [Minicystis sp.]